MGTSPKWMIDVVIISLMLQSTIVQMSTANQTAAGRNTYVVRYKHGDNVIPVTVVLDYKRQTEYVINMNPRTPAKSMTLYDFKERIIAYKDLKNGECFIGRLTHETIQDEDAILKRLKSPVESQPLILTLERDRPSLTPTEVRNMAGHKAAVFCRHTNTWTLMAAKENKRRRRDTVNQLDTSLLNPDQHSKSKQPSFQRGDQDIAASTWSNRGFSGFRINSSLVVDQHRSDLNEPASTAEATVGDSFSERLNNAYPPFILPLQKNEDRRDPTQNFNIYNTTLKNVDDSVQQLISERSNPQILSGPTEPRYVNGSLISSSNRPIIPLDSSRPVIIPSINYHNKLTSNDDNKINSPYSQNSHNFHTLYPRVDTAGNYPTFQQLPPEAFILPLTRSSSSTTPSFAFNNRLGYEIVHPESSYNHTNSISDLNESQDTSKTTSQLTNALSNHEVSTARPGASHNLSKNGDDTSTSLEDISPRANSYFDSYSNRVHLEPPERSLDETRKTYSETITPIHSDTPIQIPRWYPEITKEISIPLEIEVLHHQEEYLHGISNATDQVHSLRGQEIEDRSPESFDVTVTSLPVEEHGERFNNEIKLLPHVSAIPNGSLNQTSEKIDRTSEPELSYPLPGKEIETGAQENFPIVSSPIANGAPKSSDTKVKLVNQVSSSHKTTAEERRTSNIKPSEGTFAVHDFKIDEGVPSYRKRFPSVSQLFPPEETVADVGKLPNRHFRQQNTRRRTSTARNRTHGFSSRGHESNSVLRKHENRNFENRQQHQRFSDQGVTFHQRGYAKPGSSYDHLRKRMGLLPPGVSVHPRHPQAPYADLATDSSDKTVPVNTLLHSRPRRIHLRHHRRHQRKRNRVPSTSDSAFPSANCCGGDEGDGLKCCPGRRRNRHLPKTGCCSQSRGDRRPNLVIPPQIVKTAAPSRKKVVDQVAEEDRCMKEKMCRTVYQSTKKVLVCRNVAVDGC